MCEITINLESPLGHGNDGSVWASNRDSAIKAVYRERNYRAEVECYQRLKEAKTEKVDDFVVPRLLGFNDDLRVIEIEIVEPPYLIDFGKVSLDIPPDYPAEILAEEEERHAELYGEHWPKIASVLAQLQHYYGIYYLDPKPGNIMPAGWHDEDATNRSN